HAVLRDQVLEGETPGRGVPHMRAENDESYSSQHQNSQPHTTQPLGVQQCFGQQQDQLRHVGQGSPPNPVRRSATPLLNPKSPAKPPVEKGSLMRTGPAMPRLGPGHTAESCDAWEAGCAKSDARIRASGSFDSFSAILNTG